MSDQPTDLTYSALHPDDSLCRVELVPLSDGRTLAVVTEVDDNPGLSATEAWEQVVAAACRRFALDPRTVVWVEHYPEPMAGHARFQFVTFTLPLDGSRGRPHWRAATADDWREVGLDPRK